jgi:hypothetical protein
MAAKTIFCSETKINLSQSRTLQETNATKLPSEWMPYFIVAAV